MIYVYAERRPQLFTDHGHETLEKIRSNVARLLTEAGSFQAQKAWAGCSGDSWVMLAALDYLVETGVIAEISRDGVWAQHRVFVAGAR